MKKIFFYILLIGISFQLSAQDYFMTGHYLFLNEKNVYYQDINTVIKPSLGAESKIIDSLIFQYPKKNDKNLFLRKLYYEHLFQLQKNNFSVFIDPVLDFRMNYDKDRDKISYLNTRGFNMAGNLMSKVFFNTSFYENQGKFPNHIDRFYDKIKTLPGYARIKITEKGIYDFAQVFGSIAFKPLEQFNFSLGYDRFFIGDGYRSLLLSDFAAPYPYAKFNLKLGRFDYTTLLTKTYLPFAAEENTKYPSNLLSYSILTYTTKNQKFKIALIDALSVNNDKENYGFFAGNYFLPYIRYFALNKRDSLIARQFGINFLYRNRKIGVFYGQLVDNSEYISVENKKHVQGGISAQVGYKSFDFCTLKNLYFQLEYNYSTQWNNETFMFSNHSQSLTHPLNCNFHEIVGILSYTYKRLQILSKGNFIYTPSYSHISFDVETPYWAYFQDYTKLIYAFNFDCNNNQSGFVNYETLWYADFQLIFTVNPAYNLQVFAGANIRQAENYRYFNLNYFFNFGLRTAIRANYYDY